MKNILMINDQNHVQLALHTSGFCASLFQSAGPCVKEPTWGLARLELVPPIAAI